MIHYHGTPCGGTRDEAARFMCKRHVLIPWPRPEDIGTAAEVCQSFCIDNGAFTLWKAGTSMGEREWREYYQFVKDWARHPAFDFAIIPDAIDGDEKENDMMIAKWNNWDGWRGESWPRGVPVWHLHESLERLSRLVSGWDRVAIGSSGKWPNPGTDGWWNRMGEAMDVACDELGRPRAKLHGLRMLDPAIFHRLPLSSADSTNAVRNSSSFKRFGTYMPPSSGARMSTIADRIEAHQSAAVWLPIHSQPVLSFMGADELRQDGTRTN